MHDSSNPPLSPWVILLFVPVALILCIGVGLLVVPWLVVPHWLWELTPFNAGFLGALYLTELSVVVPFLFRNRRSPGRLVLPSALTFVAVILLLSLVNLSHFNLQRMATYAWFAVYLIPTLLLIWLLWLYRPLLASVASKPPFPWPNLLIIESVLFAIYGLWLLVTPAAATAFWPWSIDSFHARIYSAFFLTLAVGAFVIGRGAARLDVLVAGIAQTVTGIAVIIAFVITDLTVHRVNWLSGNTWMWIGMFVAIGLSGMLLIGLSYEMALFREASLEELTAPPQQPARPGPLHD